MRSGKSLFVVAWLGLLAGCARVVVDEESDDNTVTLGESKSRWSFELPSEGTPNNNAHIGPFCCTGVTAVVKSDSGYDIGWGYFYDWKGQAYLTGPDSSAAPDVDILVAGFTDLEDPVSPIEESDIAFTADELIAGSSRSTQAGALVFTVTVEHAELDTGPGGTVFDMGSLAVRLDVDVE